MKLRRHINKFRSPIHLNLPDEISGKKNIALFNISHIIIGTAYRVGIFVIQNA